MIKMDGIPVRPSIFTVICFLATCILVSYGIIYLLKALLINFNYISRISSSTQKMGGCAPCNNESRYLRRSAHAKPKRLPKHKRPKKGHKTIPLNRPNTNLNRATGLYLPQIEVRPGVRS